MRRLVKYSRNEAGLIGPPIITPKKRKKYRKRGQPRRKLWKKRKLIELLKIKAMGLGRAPYMSEMNKDPEMPSAGVYTAHFGTWNSALIAAGLPPRKSRTSMTPKEKEARWKAKQEELIEIYLKKWGELGHLPLRTEISADPEMPSLATFRKYFGNFGELLKQLDEPPLRNRKRRADGVEYTDEYLCRILRQKWYQIGRTPTWRDVGADYNMPSPSTYIRRWGTWTKALVAAKVPLNQNNVNIARSYTDEQLLQILRDLYDRLGRMPVQQDLNFNGFLPSANTYAKRFGSFAEARRMSGIKDPDAPVKTKVRVREKSPKWSKIAIAEAFYVKYKMLGRAPSWNEVNKDSNMPCMTTVRKHFENAAEAVRFYYETYPWKKTADENTTYFS